MNAVDTQTTTVRVPGHFYEWLMEGGWARAKSMIAGSTELDAPSLALVFGKVSRALDDARVTRHGKATVRHAVVDLETAEMLNRVAAVRALYNNGPGNAAYLRAARTVMDRTADAYAELNSGK